jgi:exodeoxyribonuclease VII large subunit
VAQQRLLLDQLENRLDSGIMRRLQHQRDHLQGVLGRLHLLSPFATVARGYAIVTKSDGAVLRDASAILPGERIHLQLQHGRLTAMVEKSEKNGEGKC